MIRVGRVLEFRVRIRVSDYLSIDNFLTRLALSFAA